MGRVPSVPLPESLRTSFLVHDHAPDGAWRLDEETLGLLHERLHPGAHTLETGAGTSTVLFALRGARHTAVVPVIEEETRIREYCRVAGIATDGLEFVIERSERALPRLPHRELDLVLIDGRHGFPAPMLDWYYTAPMLRIGGTLVLDDTQLWSVRMVRDVLCADTAWRLDAESAKASFFVKLADGSHDLEWTAQPWVTQQTAALARSVRFRQRRDTALRLLRRGRLLALSGAIGRSLVQELGARRRGD